MRTIEVNVYKFSELSDESKDRAIVAEIEFMLNYFVYEHSSDNFKKAVDRADKLRTPWFTGSYVYEYYKDEIIESFEANKYEFTVDGKLI